MTVPTSQPVPAMASFLRNFRDLVDRKRESMTERLALFLDSYRDYLTRGASTDRFNILDVTGVGNDEVKHSSILAWLLTPHGSHACGTQFLELFLRTAGISVSEESLAGSYVRTEFSGNESIVDILVYKPRSFVVYVENKTVSGEGDEQVDREYRDMVRVGTSVRVPRERMFPIFLSPGGRPPTSGDPRPWYPVSYGQLARQLETLLPSLQDRKIIFFVEDLIDQYDRWSSV